MSLEPLHSWDLSPKAAIALQRELARKLVSDRPLHLVVEAKKLQGFLKAVGPQQRGVDIGALDGFQPKRGVEYHAGQPHPATGGVEQLGALLG